MEEMIGDADPRVRYQLAFSLGALPGTQTGDALAGLAFRDGDDPWMRIAVLSSVSGCTGEVFHRLADNANFRTSAHGQALLTTLAARLEPPAARTTWPQSSRSWMARWPVTST